MEKRNKNGLTEKEFLEQYNPGNYERPSVTVDMMVLSMDELLSSLKILLIQRGNHPFMDSFALPGGFVEMKESAYEAACRELEEETGLKNVYLEQVYTMSQPNRDPRMRVIDIAYMALIQKMPVVAGDDAKVACWFDVSLKDNKLELINEERNVRIVYNLKEKVFQNGLVKVKNYVPELSPDSKDYLAFDHAEIILEGLMRLRNKIKYTDIAFNLVPKRFTLPDLQKVYEIILGEKLYKRNFRQSIENRIEFCNDKGVSVTGKHSSNLYKYSPKL